jgi:hypothetical protein
MLPLPAHIFSLEVTSSASGDAPINFFCSVHSLFFRLLGLLRSMLYSYYLEILTNLFPFIDGKALRLSFTLAMN